MCKHNDDNSLSDLRDVSIRHSNFLLNACHISSYDHCDENKLCTLKYVWVKLSLDWRTKIVSCPGVLVYIVTYRWSCLRTSNHCLRTSPCSCVSTRLMSLASMNWQKTDRWGRNTFSTMLLCSTIEYIHSLQHHIVYILATAVHWNIYCGS